MGRNRYYTMKPFNIYIQDIELTADNIQEVLKDQVLWAEPETYTEEVAEALTEWFNDKDYMELQTSGSTGTPKQIRILKETMIKSAEKTGDYFGLQQGTKALLGLPARYIAGKMMLIRTMVLGWDLYIKEPSAEPFEDVHASHFDFVPMTPHQLDNAYNSSKEQLNETSKILLGGAPIHKALEKKIASLDAKIFIGYGMTETVTHVAVRKLSGKHYSRIYEAIKGVHFSVTKEGYLEIEADHLLDSPIQTTDIVELISPTKFMWLGRGDHVINTGGIKVFPETIESKLAGIFEMNYFVGALEDQVLGQSVTLFLEAPEDMNCDDIKKKINTLLPKYEKPKQIVCVPLFNYTPTGKINRAKTIERFIKQS